jgi:dTDP-glucose 4,6-dehydratase
MLALGWQPTYQDFEAGLQKTIDWYQNNPAFWQKDKQAVEAFYQENEG